MGADIHSLPQAFQALFNFGIDNISTSQGK